MNTERPRAHQKTVTHRRPGCWWRVEAGGFFGSALEGALRRQPDQVARVFSPGSVRHHAVHPVVGITEVCRQVLSRLGQANSANYDQESRAIEEMSMAKTGHWDRQHDVNELPLSWGQCEGKALL